MQMAWLMTMFVFTFAFFLIFFVVYFFRPKKDDKTVPPSLEKQLMDPEQITFPSRVQPNWPATIKTGAGKTADCAVTAITHGSAFLESDLQLPIGEKFQLVIRVPDRMPLELRAEVIWSNLHLPADKVLNRGMGIRFIEAGEEAICLISQTLDQHARKLAAGQEKNGS